MNFEENHKFFQCPDLRCYKLFNNIFLYPSNVELDEKLIYKNNRLLKFHIENNKVVIEHCPNCNHELYYECSIAPAASKSK